MNLWNIIIITMFFSCYSLLKNSLNYDNNKLFYVNFHYFSLFSWLFIVSIMFFDFR